MYDEAAENFYGEAARKLFTVPESADPDYFKGERRYWQGVRAVLNAPKPKITTRGDVA